MAVNTPCRRAARWDPRATKVALARRVPSECRDRLTLHEEKAGKEKRILVDKETILVYTKIMKKRRLSQATRIFRALGVEKRGEILHLLARRTLCVGALSRLVGISPGAVSQHLRVLRDAGLVEADRMGYFVHYRIVPGSRQRCLRHLSLLFGTDEGGKNGCVARRQNARGPSASRAGRKSARRSR